MHRLGSALVLASIATLLGAAPASAGTMTLGSPLTSAANITEQWPEDSAFWNFLVAGASGAMPFDGQITLVRLKGTVPPHPDPAAPPPLNDVHFQSLEPLDDGTVKVRLSSAVFFVPVGTSPNTITEYRPENLCVEQGDFVAFNDEGGFDPTYYPNGVPFQVFGSVPMSRLARFTKHNGTNNGQILTPIFTEGRELLMQVVLAYGPDASLACGGRPVKPGPCANSQTGNGSLIGTAGGDNLIGGPGADTLQGFAGDDCLFGEAGVDQLNGGAGKDKLFGRAGNDVLLGGSGVDYLSGDFGNDRLDGGAGVDRVSGGSENDIAGGGSGNDVVTGGSGNDRVAGGTGSDRLSGNAGNDRLIGSAGSDRISGHSGGDVITGGTGADRLTGGSGPDRISGGRGNDRISARDLARDVVTCGPGRDRVTADRADRVSRSCERVSRG